MVKRKSGVRMWGYVPAASAQRAPILKPIRAPKSSSLEDEQFQSVSGGGCGFALAITESGKITTWGSPDDLGQSVNSPGKRQEQCQPHILDVNAKISQAAGGWAHAVAVTDGGLLWSWGWKDCAPTTNLIAKERTEGSANVSDSAVGNDEVAPMPPLVSVAAAVIITSVAAGGRHSLALSDIGQVWGWGYGEEGQLGVGHRLQMTSIPQLVSCFEAANGKGSVPEFVNGTRVTHIACGGRHSAVVTDNGEVLTFGWGLYGQCGLGNTEDQLSPGYVSALGGIRVTGLAAGLWHTAFVTDAGDVYATGGNQFGQLGTLGEKAEMLPTLIDAPILENAIVMSVSCGARHTIVLTNEGKVFGWGWNKYGQLGVGDTHQRDSPVEVTLENAKVIKIACGWWHTLALVEEIDC